MALNTARNRQSVVSTGKPWHPRVIVPTGTFDQGDRQHIGMIYAGINVQTPAVVTSKPYYYLLLRERRLH